MCWALNHQNTSEIAQGHISLSGVGWLRRLMDFPVSPEGVARAGTDDGFSTSPKGMARAGTAHGYIASPEGVA
jgi:hypothetical protein